MKDNWLREHNSNNGPVKKGLTKFYVAVCILTWILAVSELPGHFVQE